MTTFITSAEFRRRTREAERSSLDGPVVVMDRQRPAYVLLSFSEYERLTFSRGNIAEMLSMPAADAIDFEPPCMGLELEPPEL